MGNSQLTAEIHSFFHLIYDFCRVSARTSRIIESSPLQPALDRTSAGIHGTTYLVTYTKVKHAETQNNDQNFTHLPCHHSHIRDISSRIHTAHIRSRRAAIRKNYKATHVEQTFSSKDISFTHSFSLNMRATCRRAARFHQLPRTWRKRPLCKEMRKIYKDTCMQINISMSTCHFHAHIPRTHSRACFHAAHAAALPSWTRAHLPPRFHEGSARFRRFPHVSACPCMTHDVVQAVHACVHSENQRKHFDFFLTIPPGINFLTKIWPNIIFHTKNDHFPNC